MVRVMEGIMRIRLQFRNLIPQGLETLHENPEQRASALSPSTVKPDPIVSSTPGPPGDDPLEPPHVTMGYNKLTMDAAASFRSPFQNHPDSVREVSLSRRLEYRDDDQQLGQWALGRIDEQRVASKLEGTMPAGRLGSTVLNAHQMMNDLDATSVLQAMADSNDA